MTSKPAAEQRDTMLTGQAATRPLTPDRHAKHRLPPAPESQDKQTVDAVRRLETATIKLAKARGRQQNPTKQAPASQDDVDYLEAEVRRLHEERDQILRGE